MEELKKIELTDDVLEKLGFTEYDDEHCTWGNRRLLFDGDSDEWKKLQIIENCESCAEENGYPAQFVYAEWFDQIRRKPTGGGRMDLTTLYELYICIDIYRPELLDEFKIKLKTAGYL